MAHIRPSTNFNGGRVQMPLRVNILDLLVGSPVQTFITTDTASGVATLTVKNITGFAINQILLIGQPGMSGSEIIKTHASTAPTGSTITLASNLALPHSGSTFVYIIPYDQVEFSRATTITGAKVVLSTTSILAAQQNTIYNDTTNSSGYYFARYKETITNTFSDYSDSAPYAGYGLLSARALISAALEEIGKQKSSTLSDVFFYTQLDNCQTETLRELKRWSFMQKFDAIIGALATGSWKVAMPTDVDDQNTNRSVFQVRVGTQQRLTWVDKEKFDEFLIGVAYNTLSTALTLGNTTMVLTDSSDLDATGTVTIGANSYDYTANDITTNTLTLSAAITASNTAPIASDVFQGATKGLPQYWTTYGGSLYYWPTTADTYNGNNIYMDYYIAQTRVTDDYSNIIFPDPTCAIYYLAWKALKKLNNGEETIASAEYKQEYETRRQKMKDKEVLGKTFKLHPRLQNFHTASQFNEDTPRSIRDSGFPNTGF